jgi:histone H3
MNYLSPSLLQMQKQLEMAGPERPRPLAGSKVRSPVYAPILRVATETEEAVNNLLLLTQYEDLTPPGSPLVTPARKPMKVMEEGCLEAPETALGREPVEEAEEGPTGEQMTQAVTTSVQEDGTEPGERDSDAGSEEPAVVEEGSGGGGMNGPEGVADAKKGQKPSKGKSIPLIGESLKHIFDINKKTVQRVKRQRRAHRERVRRRRVNPGIRALKDIWKAQRTTKLCMRVTPFRRLCKGVIQRRAPGFRVTQGALEALQESTEAFLIEYLEKAQQCAFHRKVVTVAPRDLHLVTRLCDSTPMYKEVGKFQMAKSAYLARRREEVQKLTWTFMG